MTTVNDSIRPRNFRRNIILGCILLIAAVFCVVMTVIFAYVSNQANQQLDSIRKDYREAAMRREAKVDAVSEQVKQLQHKLDVLPNRTADMTADKVKSVVKEENAR